MLASGQRRASGRVGSLNLNVRVVEQTHSNLADLVIAKLIRLSSRAIARDVGRKMGSDRYLGVVCEVVERMP